MLLRKLTVRLLSQQKDTNENINVAPHLKLLKGKRNENNFEGCMKSSKSITHIPFISIEQMF